MLSLRANMKNTVNTQKIHDFANKAVVRILVGYPSGLQHIGSSDGSGKRTETAELAKRLSFGDKSVPARPFLEEGLATKKTELHEELKKQLEAAKNGKNPNFDKVGTMAVGAIQAFVRSDHYKNEAPNSKKTIASKGSDMPLIDTAEMLNSTTYLVEGK